MIECSFKKDITYDGMKACLTVNAALCDAYVRGHDVFNVTGSLTVTKGTHAYPKGTVLHDGIDEIKADIAEYMPYLIPVARMDGCNEFGQPDLSIMRLLINGAVTEEKMADILHCSDDTLKVLRRAAKFDKYYLTYMFVKTGLTAEWARDAEAAIKVLEEHAGQAYSHTENPQGVITWDDKFISCIAASEASGMYTEKALMKEKSRRRGIWESEMRESSERRYASDMKFVRRRHELEIWLSLNSPTENMMFNARNGYEYGDEPKYTAGFNVYDYKEHMTRAEFDAFLERDDIPDDLNIEFRE